jgi:hypothetical protein
MLHVPGLGTPCPSPRADYFRDDEGSLPRGRELVHAVGLLDASKDEVANVEGGFSDVAIMIVT